VLAPGLARIAAHHAPIARQAGAIATGRRPLGPARRFHGHRSQPQCLARPGLSAIVFAGAAQLVAIGMLKGGANLFSILLTTLLLTSQHLLYGLSMRPVLSGQRWRLGLGFLLTDEFFALTSHHDQQQFNRWYALGWA
jgi:predicted branched-subunit amino acid permease